MINCLILKTVLGRDIIYKSENIENQKVKHLNTYIEQHTGLPVKNQHLFYSSKHLNPDKFIGDYKIQNGSVIDVKARLKGGIGGMGGIGKAIGKAFKSAGNAIIDGLLMIFQPVLDAIEDLGRIIWWVMKLIFWVITDVINPAVWFKSVLYGIFDGIRIMILSIISIIFAFIKKIFNAVFEPALGNIWGYDIGDKKAKCRKCFTTRTGTVPVSVIIGTILLPPLGVFMELGMTGWINILICALLTLLFYFPGLIYALVLLFC